MKKIHDRISAAAVDFGCARGQWLEARDKHDHSVTSLLAARDRWLTAQNKYAAVIKIAQGEIQLETETTDETQNH
jgi:hypothetical protein